MVTDPMNIALWLPASTQGRQIKSAVKEIISKHDTIDTLLVVLDDSVKATKRTFGGYYWMIRDAYKMALAAMSVETGLKIDLQVYVYPEYLAVDILIKDRPDLLIYHTAEYNLPEKVSGLKTSVIELENVDSVSCTPVLKQREEFDDMAPGSLNVVALGGTFDRLHAGHKLMLSSAIVLASKSVVIGLTDASMLASKKFLQVLESYESRHRVLMRFVESFAGPRLPSMNIQVVPLHDPYGPTITDTEIDLLVVSEETLPGAEQINRIRREKGMTELQIVPVEFVKLSSGERISSSLIRSQSSV